MTAEVRIIGVGGVGEVRPGDDVLAAIRRGFATSEVALQRGDLLVVTHKIVSKAEGKLVDLRAIEPSPFARDWAARWGKDARQIEVVLREAVRIVRMDRGIIIAETRHGLVCANAGVDASNVAGEHVVCVLPDDPDRSARQLAERLRSELGFDVPVIITDSFGRAWRNGLVNVAIGVAGMEPLIDYRGQHDPYGYLLNVSVLAVADEIAAAAELVMGKIDQSPVAVVRGYRYTPGDSAGRHLIMDRDRDLFR